MALTPIIKGMADGAEAIQANFTAIGEIEKGTNANGTYIKFPDGTMICHTRVALNSINMQNPWGALFISAEFPTTFPATFFVPPVVSVNMENLTGDGAIWMNALSTVGSFTGRFVRGSALTFTATLGWMAVGRWK